MLVLSRKEGQTIVLDGVGVTFSVERISGEQVKIGIEAPPGVTIRRGELESFFRYPAPQLPIPDP